MKLEKITNLTKNFSFALARLGVLTAFLATFTLSLHAQCPLGCNNSVQISLDGTCSAVISPDVVLEGMGTCTNDDYTVTIEMADGSTITTATVGGVITHPSVGVAHIGQTLTVRINDTTASGGLNSCWGFISVEDKLAPVLSCPTDITVGCNESIVSSDFTHGAVSSSFSYDQESGLVLNGTDVPYDVDPGASVTAQQATDGGTICADITVNGLNQFDIVNTIEFDLNLTPQTVLNMYSIDIYSPAGALVNSFTSTNGMNLNITNAAYLGVQATDAIFEGDWRVCITDNLGADNIQFRFTGGQVNFNTRGFFNSQLTAADNCNTITFTTLTDNTVDIDCDDAANPGISAIRTITCQASDASGNLSNICTKNIYYERKTLSDIVWPANYSVECSVSTSTSPDDTGRPTIGGEVIHPNNGFCEINLTYNDDMIDVCGVSFKLLRNWIALDWCEATSTTHTQIIKIADTEGPSIQCGESYFDIDVNPYTCTADFTVPFPNIDSEPLNDVIKFDCSEVTYRIKWSEASIPADGVCNNTNASSAFNYKSDGVSYDGNAADLDADGFASTGTFTITGLPAGCIWIYFEVKDACGNITTCTKDIKVVDNTPPTPVCDQNTVITLNTSGWAHAFALTFDDGSHDNCSSTISYGVRRMSDTCGQFTGATAGSNPTEVFTFGGTRYYDFVKFCCNDVDVEDVMVELVVWDATGNANTCMVNVRVDNKVTPVITCTTATDNQSIDCADAIPAVPNVADVFTISNDNCGKVAVEYLGETSTTANTCGIYSITRSFRAYNTVTLATLRSCNQTISITNSVPFNLNTQVSFPADKTFTGCMMVDTDPENPTGPGVPSYTGNTNCSQLAYTYSDQTFNFVEDACFKILRTWTVIDWCTYNQNQPNGDGIRQYTQIIKINNSVGPVFASCSTVSFSTFDDECEGDIEFITVATDDCTPADQIVYSYVIDAFNDGTGADITGNGSNASGTYPVGTHSITWTAEDQCGNITECTQLFIVRDAKNPTPYCLSGITTVVMPSTGTIGIWANDFDLGSFDNCTPDASLRFSFSSSTSNTSKTYTCDDLGINMVQIWVTDLAGNQDYCETMIDIQNTGGCTESPKPMVAGRVATETGADVDNVEVMLENMSTYVPTMMMTQSDGLYAFNNNAAGHVYQVSASRNDNHMNGVSTLDLVLIQKHILGITDLDSPYKVIAADINNSANVSATDLIELRKLILGIYDELPNNESWRFVDATQGFADANNPWPIQSQIDIAQLNSDDVNNDFKAVKIGDVTGNAEANAQSGNVSGNRSSKTLSLVIDNQSYTKDELVEVVFTSANFDKIVGMQYTLSFDETSLEFVNVSSDALNITAQNVNANNADLGLISMSWSDYKSTSLDSDEEVYTLTFRAKANNVLTNTIYGMSSELTQTEAYNNDLEVLNLNLEVRNTDMSNGFALGQNTPNPFDTDTQISFTLPESMIAQLSIYDVAGRKITTINNTYNKGQNVITIDNTLLEGATGVLYYRLEAGDFTATKKMIVIQ